MSSETYLSLQPADTGDAALGGTIDYIAAQGARLDVLVTGVALPTIGFEGVPSGWVAFCESMQARVTGMRDEVKDALATADIPASVTAIFSDVGRFGPEIERHALCADYVLIADHEQLEHEVGKMLFHSALFQCRKPVLLLGEQSDPVAKTVVVAWKNDPHSAAAIHHALPHLKRADSVVLTTVDPHLMRDGPNPGRNMAAYLAHHGVTVTVDNRPGTGGSVADALLECATDHGADLIVAGAFGRSRLRDWILGSSTRRLVDSKNTSLLLAH